MTTATAEAKRIVRDRERAQRDELIRTEAARIEAERLRERAREESARRIQAQREAEQHLRASDETSIVIRYGAIVVTAWPERSGDYVKRRHASVALSEASAAFQVHFEQRVGAARAAALGKTVPVESAERLVVRLRDLCRLGLASGLVTVEVEG